MRHPNTSGRSIRCIACAVLALSGTVAIAATVTGEAQTRFAQERARCLSGQSGQAQSTCLKEAVNAREAALKGQLADGDGKLRKNAKERCDALTGDEQRDCLARVRGASNTTESGSVKGGGIVRETVTVEPAPAAPAAPAASVAPAASPASAR